MTTDCGDPDGFYWAIAMIMLIIGGFGGVGLGAIAVLWWQAMTKKPDEAARLAEFEESLHKAANRAISEVEDRGRKT
jgi:hypothetical protein